MRYHAMVTAPFHNRVLDFRSLARMQYDVALESDAAVFVITPWPFMPDALMLLDSWGFPYITTPFIWDYVKEDRSPVFDLTYAHTAPILVGGRGDFRQGFASPTPDATVTAHVLRVKKQGDSIPVSLLNSLRRLTDDKRLYVTQRGSEKAAGWHHTNHSDPLIRDVTIRMHPPNKRPWPWTFNDPSRVR